MSKKFSRRDFLKVAGVGAATSAVLTGCGPASRYVTREQYLQMPEYTLNGQSTYFATTCRECAAGCGLVVRTFQGRALKVEGNPNHPVNLGKTCPRGQLTLQGLYNPDRVEAPTKQGRQASGLSNDQITWDEAVQLLAGTLENNQPSEIAFLMGMAPDHLFDLVTDLAKATGINAPVRFGVHSTFETRATLVKAAGNMLGQAALPFFDLSGADVVFSFGANFLETWLAPVSFTRGFMNMRKGTVTGKRGFFVQFEPRMSQTASKADQWIPVAPGTEGLVALAIGKLAAEVRGGAMPRAFEGVNVEDVVVKSGVALEQLEQLAQLLANAASPVAIPGGAALAQTNGLANAEAVLALNSLAGNNGVSFSPAAPLPSGSDQQPASMQQMQEFVQQMADGKFKVLFVHGVNPAFELPAALDFAGASSNVGQIISFATYPDETAMLADYIFPDHHGLESWGYQRVATGTAQATLSGAQPVVVPFTNTRSTVDVLLAAAQLAGGDFAATLPFGDEVAFIQNKVGAIMGDTEGFYSAPDLPTFMAYFQQHGGWWKNAASPVAPSAGDVLNKTVSAGEPAFTGEGEFVLLPFMSPTLGDNGANKPWLQEIADPTTTVMWGTWVEMNPKTAEEMGIASNDVLKITSEAGEVEVPVYLYPAIRPDVIAIPFGQGHTAYGRYAAGRGVNPMKLLGLQFNEAGDLAFASMKVKVTKTGANRPLSRLEGVLGVYGFDAK
ncbi:MAG: molybdopterin-dependent oxidoreductase [Chloroflexota bacterium]